MDGTATEERTFEQMLEEGVGGLTGHQCTALFQMVAYHPSSEVGVTAQEWAARLHLAVGAVRAAMRELTAPRRRPLRRALLRLCRIGWRLALRTAAVRSRSGAGRSCGAGHPVPGGISTVRTALLKHQNVATDATN